MIPIQRVSAPTNVQELLASRTTKVRLNGGTYEAAQAQWALASAAKKHLQSLLGEMAHGAKRCMYCEDNLGTDIDHFQPMKKAPLRSFDWQNHLLACSHCNSNLKRELYPCDANGHCLLINPVIDDPFDHLTLLLKAGTYTPKTPKGESTIEVFALNRSDLIRGRQVAFSQATSMMINWHQHTESGNLADAEVLANHLSMSPFAAVVRAMIELDPVLDEVVLRNAATPAVRAWRAKD